MRQFFFFLALVQFWGVAAAYGQDRQATPNCAEITTAFKEARAKKEYANMNYAARLGLEGSCAEVELIIGENFYRHKEFQKALDYFVLAAGHGSCTAANDLRELKKIEFITSELPPLPDCQEDKSLSEPVDLTIKRMEYDKEIRPRLEEKQRLDAGYMTTARKYKRALWPVLIVGLVITGVGMGIGGKGLSSHSVPLTATGFSIGGVGIITSFLPVHFYSQYHRYLEKAGYNIHESVSGVCNSPSGCTVTTTYSYDPETRYREFVENEAQKRDSLYPDPFDTSTMDAE